MVEKNYTVVLLIFRKLLTLLLEAICVKHFGINGKLIVIIQSMHSDIRTCVQLSGNISQFFEKFVGLLQGDVLSPMLFTFYVKNLENIFLNEDNMPIELNTLGLFNIMYAHDMVNMC